jgi:hypothetical protein
MIVFGQSIIMTSTREKGEEIMTGKLTACLMMVLALMTTVISGPGRAEGADKSKAGGSLGSLWTLPKEGGKITLVLSGQSEPVALAVSDMTIFGGICQDCSLPLEFKPGEAQKKCNVCGCSASNAACIVGKPVKEGTWQAMIGALPVGAGLRPTYNAPDKPESGIKKLVVDLRSVLLPVSGLDSLTPDQILALVKPMGGNKAELIDGGKRLTILLKSDWTVEREGKLEKAMAKFNAKVVVPEPLK